MIQKKICMLGAFAVGKTSLVWRFVKSIFSEDYHTTLGVTIERKEVSVGEQVVNMVLWDLAGESEFQKVRNVYFRGAAGYLLVVDGTRLGTLTTALDLQERIAELIGPVPFVLLLNKADLHAEWEIPEETTGDLVERGWVVVRTSAKTGEGVNEAFVALAESLVR